MSANRNIIRIERVNTGGYLVRITRKSKMHMQYFSDTDFGGKRKSLLAAREHRDEMETKLKGYTPKEIANRERSNNTSGVVGVRYVEELDPRWKSKPVYGYWVAQWSPEPGVRKTQRFSIEKYGDDEAYELAVKARKKGVRSMGK